MLRQTFAAAAAVLMCLTAFSGTIAVVSASPDPVEIA